jgi:hypothetical protein
MLPNVTLNPILTPAPLLLKDAKTLLTNKYLPLEAGYALNSDGMWNVAGEAYMKDVTGSMIDWWFGYVTNSEQCTSEQTRNHPLASSKA